MPTALRDGPYRFFFYAGDRDEPPHTHAERDACEAKVWLDPIRLDHSRGFSQKKLRDILKRVAKHREHLLEAWNDFFHD